MAMCGDANHQLVVYTLPAPERLATARHRPLAPMEPPLRVPGSRSTLGIQQRKLGQQHHHTRGVSYIHSFP